MAKLPTIYQQKVGETPAIRDKVHDCSPQAEDTRANLHRNTHTEQPQELRTLRMPSICLTRQPAAEQTIPQMEKESTGRNIHGTFPTPLEGYSPSP